jgi:hypothetical protein
MLCSEGEEERREQVSAQETAAAEACSDSHEEARRVSPTVVEQLCFQVEPYDRHNDAEGVVLEDVARIEKHAFPKHEALTNDLRQEVSKRNTLLLLARNSEGRPVLVS